MDLVTQAVLRQDFLSFLHKAFATLEPSTRFRQNWHHEAIAHALTEVEGGSCQRLMINQPPRSLKSICASVAYPAWLFGRDPGQKILCVSYGSELALDLHRKFRVVVESDWYRAIFPNVVWRRKTDNEYATTRGGGRVAVSVGGALTGRGADIIIVDDPLKPEEAASEAERTRVNGWYGETLVSRTNQKRDDRIVIVMQRLHEDDLCGHLLEKDDDNRWSQLVLPAIAVSDQEVLLGPSQVYHRKAGEVLDAAREPREILDRIRTETGSRVFEAQYQQQPVPSEGNLINPAWFKTFTGKPPCLEEFGPLIVQSWDTASQTGESNDFSVCTTWQVWGGDAYLLDVLRERMAYPKLRQMVATMAERWGTQTILIEDAGAGMHLIQDLLATPPRGIPHPIRIRPQGDKAMRFEAQTPLIEAGQVFLPEDAPWKAAYLNELCAFPRGRHDDQVDSTSQFLAHLQRNPGRRSSAPRIFAMCVTNPSPHVGYGLTGAF